ncbi:hypothetical protein INR49_027389 [Caranx melampygus]|nr:hypothetical protein INR49_027389 [Caranx melampygus]
MGQPLVREQLRRTQRPPRLHTALQLGFKQQDSQHVAPPLPSARGCQPRLMMLLQWIPSTPPVTRHRSADTPDPGQKGGRRLKELSQQQQGGVKTVGYLAKTLEPVNAQRQAVTLSLCSSNAQTGFNKARRLRDTEE